MFAARFLLFRLHESPRYLVARDRQDEALTVLQKISDFNGGTKEYEREDVSVPLIVHCPGMSMHTRGCEDELEEEQRDDQKQESTVRKVDESSPIRSSDPRQISGRSRSDSASPLFGIHNGEGTGPVGSVESRPYAALGVTPASHPTSQFSFHTPSEELAEVEAFDFRRKLPRHKSMPQVGHGTTIPEVDSPELTSGDEEDATELADAKSGAPARHHHSRLMRAAWAWYDRMAMLFVPRWRRTTILMWIIWGLMSLGACVEEPARIWLLMKTWAPHSIWHVQRLVTNSPGGEIKGKWSSRIDGGIEAIPFVSSVGAARLVSFTDKSALQIIDSRVPWVLREWRSETDRARPLG